MGEKSFVLFVCCCFRNGSKSEAHHTRKAYIKACWFPKGIFAVHSTPLKFHVSQQKEMNEKLMKKVRRWVTNPVRTMKRRQIK